MFTFFVLQSYPRKLLYPPVAIAFLFVSVSASSSPKQYLFSGSIYVFSFRTLRDDVRHFARQRSKWVRTNTNNWRALGLRPSLPRTFSNRGRCWGRRQQDTQISYDEQHPDVQLQQGYLVKSKEVDYHETETFYFVIWNHQVLYFKCIVSRSV